MNKIGKFSQCKILLIKNFVASELLKL